MIAGLYKVVGQIKNHWESLKKLEVELPKNKTIEEHEQKLIDSAINDVVEKIIKKYEKNIAPTRIQELRKSISDSVKFIAKSVDQGIEVEIIPPYL